MPAFSDIAGRRFGRLVAVAPVNVQGRYKWDCRCDCGALTTVDGRELRSGGTLSCGCLRRDTNRTHGCSQRTPTYRSWEHMLQRCFNPNEKHFADYGGRGITVCDRWRGTEGFANFLADMGERPPGKTVDRYPDNDGDYRPGNCRWATQKEQNANRRTRGRDTYLRGERHARTKLTAAQVEIVRDRSRSRKSLAAEFGVSIGCIDKIRCGQCWGNT